jgi:hypothetical protein
LTEINTGLGWKAGKTYWDNDPAKQAVVAILISGKVDFKLTFVKQDKEGHFILKKGATHQKEKNNYQHMFTQCQCTQFHQAYTKGFQST